MSSYFYRRIRSEGRLCDAERDLLAIAKFLVMFTVLLLSLNVTTSSYSLYNYVYMQLFSCTTILSILLAVNVTHIHRAPKSSTPMFVMFPTIPSVCCRTTFRKLEVRICGN